MKSQCAQRPASNYISRIQVLSSNWSTSINKVCAWIFVWVVYTLRIASTRNTTQAKTVRMCCDVMWCVYINTLCSSVTKVNDIPHRILIRCDSTRLYCSLCVRAWVWLCVRAPFECVLRMCVHTQRFASIEFNLIWQHEKRSNTDVAQVQALATQHHYFERYFLNYVKCKWTIESRPQQQMGVWTGFFLALCSSRRTPHFAATP